MNLKPSIAFLLRNRGVFDLALIAFASAAFIFQFGYAVFPDTSTYISADPLRTPGYPLIISIFKMLFGNFYLTALSFSQLFSWIYVSLIFSTKICNIFGVNLRFKYIYFVILCLPLLPAYQYGNSILTEALSFVVSLVIFIQIYKVYKYNKYIDYVILLAFTVFALTLRPQMAYFVVAFVALSVALLASGHLKKSFMFIMVATVSYFGGATIDKAYHYFKHGFYGQIAFAGTQMIVLPFFTMTNLTVDQIENEDDKQLVLKMVSLAESQGLRQPPDSANANVAYRPVYAFAAQYNLLRMGVIHKAIEDMQPGLSGVETDQLLVRLSISILKSGMQNEPVAFVKGYANNLIYLGFGNPLYFVICLVALLAAFVLFLKRQSPDRFLALAILLAHFVNIGVVVVLQPVMFRYSFYTELPMTILLSIFTISAITYNTTNGDRISSERNETTPF